MNTTENQNMEIRHYSEQKFFKRTVFLTLIHGIDGVINEGQKATTGHSFRRGFVHFALANGMTLLEIMKHGDWRSYASVKRYATGAELDIVSKLGIG